MNRVHGWSDPQHDRDHQALSRRDRARFGRFRGRTGGDPRAARRERGGKSTLLKILSGAQPPDAGAIGFSGTPIALRTPHDAQKLGIVTIYQELTLAPNLTIAENVFIGREPGPRPFVSWRKLAAETEAIIRRLGLELDPMALVRDLSVAEQQLVEIARGLSMELRLIVMDEPTSALSSVEVDKLFRIIRDLRASGISVIFVTHRLEEVMAICDRYTRAARRSSGGSRFGRRHRDRRHHQASWSDGR